MENKQFLSDLEAHGAGHVVYLALKRVIAIA